MKELRQQLTLLTTQRSDWYDGHHHASRWVMAARTIMVWLGTGGVLAAAIAAGLRGVLLDRHGQADTANHGVPCR